MVNRIFRGLLLAHMLFLSGYIHGQDFKRNLDSSEFGLWERLGMITPSSTGTHLYYTLQRGENEIIHRIKSLYDNSEREYIGIRNATFINYKDRFVYITRGDTLVVESLLGNMEYQIDSVAAMHVLSEGKFLLLSDRNWYSTDPKTVRILNMVNGAIQILHPTLSVALSPDQSCVAVISVLNKKRILHIINPNQINNSFKIDLSFDKTPVLMNWTNDSRSLSFVLQRDEDKILSDSIGLVLNINRPDSFKWIDISSIYGWDHSSQLVQHNRSYPMLSQDKKRLFLSTSLTATPVLSPQTVEIWKSKTQWLFPYQKSGDVASWGKLGYIDLENESFISMTRPQEVEGVRGLGDEFVLHVDKSNYLPAYKFKGDFFDLRISKVGDSLDALIDTAIRDHGVRIMYVDLLKKVAYYHFNHWYLYDPIVGAKKQLTRAIPYPISECANCNRGLAIGDSDLKFYVFDEQNLWQIDSSGQNVKQLTGLDRQDITYKFNSNFYGYGKSYEILKVNPDKGIYLEGVNPRTGETGFFKWSESKGLETIVYGNKKVQFLGVLPKNNGYFYTHQSFELSPQVVWKRKIQSPEKIVVHTNLQQSSYHWGKSEMVHYRSSRTYKTSGRELHGALFYPANYDPNKKYPLIVSIYEDNSYTLHEYQNPGINRFIDFNPTDYTLDGYFVLQPSLLPRERSNPGHSMMINLQAAVDYMKSTGMIDPNRIGLYGHSFGGYEALFAATQIHDFATIIAGAPISDLVTDYFTHRPLLRGPSFYRSETQQFNMRKSYFEIPEMYEANSPFRYIQNVTTPLLIWAGKSDVNVGVEQSIQFYLGMLRLEKECTLILYPDEDHVLAKPENLTDLDTRMKQWFNHYLKDGPKEDWMGSR